MSLNFSLHEITLYIHKYFFHIIQIYFLILIALLWKGGGWTKSMRKNSHKISYLAKLASPLKLKIL